MNIYLTILTKSPMLATQLMWYILITLTNAITRTKQINLSKSRKLRNVNKEKNAGGEISTSNLRVSNMTRSHCATAPHERNN